MDRKLLQDALIKVTAGILILGLLLFLPAGTFSYPQAWLLLGILFIPMVAAGFVMMKKNPELLRKRLNVKEKEKEQQEVVKFSALMFVLGFVLAGLSFRFGWLLMPMWVSWVGAGLFLGCYLLYAEVLRENAYLSRTVEVQENQKVIDTGLYSIVRHPMYMVTLGLFLSMAVVLGSVLCLIVFLVYPLLIVKRIRSEEKVLMEGLAGYAVYCQKVKYHLIPYIW